MDVINENEVQFLSSLEQGGRLIHRTLSRMDYKHAVFPGQFTSDYNSQQFSLFIIRSFINICICSCLSLGGLVSAPGLGFPSGPGGPDVGGEGGPGGPTGAGPTDPERQGEASL